jgi:hypothetical protein
MSGLDKPGGTEYRRATRDGVDGAARGTPRAQHYNPLQITQEPCQPRSLRDDGHEPERTRSAPGTDPMLNTLRMCLTALCEGGLP